MLLAAVWLPNTFSRAKTLRHFVLPRMSFSLLRVLPLVLALLLMLPQRSAGWDNIREYLAARNMSERKRQIDLGAPAPLVCGALLSDQVVRTLIENELQSYQIPPTIANYISSLRTCEVQPPKACFTAPRICTDSFINSVRVVFLFGWFFCFLWPLFCSLSGGRNVVWPQRALPRVAWHRFAPSLTAFCSS